MVLSDDTCCHAKPRLVPRTTRAVVVLALILCGAAAIVYATAFHGIPVQSAPPKPDAAPTGEAATGQPETPSVEAAPPSEAASAQPATVMEFEPALVKEVSVSGVERAPDGGIQRTYTGRPPSQCVT